MFDRSYAIGLDAIDTDEISDKEQDTLKEKALRETVSMMARWAIEYTAQAAQEAAGAVSRSPIDQIGAAIAASSFMHAFLTTSGYSHALKPEAKTCTQVCAYALLTDKC